MRSCQIKVYHSLLMLLLLSGTSCVAPGKSANLVASVASNGAPNSSGGTSATPQPTSTATSTPSPTPPPAPLAINAVSAQSMNLGVTLSIPITIQPMNGYSGPVSLSLDKKVIAANDPMGTITASISPATVNLSGSTPASATVTVNTTSASPDMISSLQVLATSSTGAQISRTIPLTVNAVFEVDIINAGTLDTNGIEDWSIAAGTTTSFTTHPNGLQINFCNKDTVEKSGFYRIHSSGTAFLHQGSEGLGLPGTMTPDVNDGTVAKSKLEALTVGPCYTVNVLSQVAKLTNIYYDHNNETPAKATRTMVFNAFAAPAKIGNSGNPDASFAYIEKNLIATQCMSCHVTSPATLGNNVNLGTYAGMLSQVQAGSYLGSPLYVQIAAGGTMPLGSPGTVSTALLKDVEDWINDGALNN